MKTVRYYAQTEKFLKAFILSFYKKWLISSVNEFLISTNTLTVLRFHDGNVGTWLGVAHVNTAGGSLGLSLL